MAGKDEENKVRPIDFVPDDALPFDPGMAEEPKPVQWTKRPILALAVSVIAVLIAVGAVAVFGALEFAYPGSEIQEPSASDDTDVTAAPPDTLPPRLDAGMGLFTDRLTLIALEDDRLQTLRWDPTLQVSSPYDLPITSIDKDAEVDASFDSSGRMLAIRVLVGADTSVYLGQPTDVAKSEYLGGSTSLGWHATEVGALSWLMPRGSGLELHTGKVNPLSGEVNGDRVVADFDRSVELVRWDSSGFVLNTGTSIVALDGDGEATWSHDGTAISGSTSIVAAIVADEDTGETRWVIVDRATGDPTTDTIDGPPRDVWVATSRDSDLIASVSRSLETTNIVVHGSETGPKRVVRIELAGVPQDFSSIGEYLEFHEFESNDVIFVNWQTGLIHVVPIPEGLEIIASDL